MKLDFPSTIGRPLKFGDLEIDPHNWSDWKWQLRFSLKTSQQLARYFGLSRTQVESIEKCHQYFKAQCTPYYASLARPGKEHDPIRRQILPSHLELQSSVQQMHDPLAEEKNSPTSRIIHRYPDRVLFLVTDICGIYCRYCTRKHFTGKDWAFARSEELEAAYQYIQNHSGVREVIVSGGDPLTLSDFRIENILRRLRTIEHIELVRIGSRMPTVCPMRITLDFTSMLKKYSPLVMMTHFNHPRELTLETKIALDRLVEAGVPIYNQTVLLNGINNHPAIIQALCRRLMHLRVKPYYLHICDPSMGSDHLRVSIDEALEIQKNLWGKLSGLAMPQLCLDIPNGGGKMGWVPQFQTSHQNQVRKFCGFDEVQGEYISPPRTNSLIPEDVVEYENEWMQL